MNKFSANFLVIFFMSVPVLVFAADFGLQNPINVNSISDLILIVTRVVRYIAIPFVVIMIMWVGFLYIWYTVTGKAAKDANQKLMYVVIGAFILLSSELVALVIRNTINGLTN